MALNWISRHCNRVSYILKTDDDMLINMFSILNHLSTLTYLYPTEAWHSTIACLIWTRMRVTRDPSSKWFVTSDEYPYEHFESYCSGSAYFITQDLIQPLFEATRYIPFFWIDDYYMTGLLPRAIRSSMNVKYLYINSLFVVNVDVVEQRFLSPFGLSSLVFAHMPLSVNRLLHIWQHLMTNSQSAHKYLNRTFL
jgi:beta-1,3-galactosyltransferase 1